MTELISVSTGMPVRLGPELARGGEGVVHTLLDSPDRLAKLYLTVPDAEKRAKLQAMLEASTESLTRIAAWPAELVADRQGKVRGFIMRKAPSSAEAHELYTPRSRAHAFPEADFRFVLHVAANLVRSFGALHQAGYVIGDVNHAQVLVGLDGKVMLIDCDSFQVESDGRLHTCDVGSPLFTPPELQGQSFRGLRRTADHDRFGLAVLLFQLLFMGRHPYAGVPQDPGQSTEIEAAIKADRFAYGADRRLRGVEQPPGTLPLSIYGPEVSDLFERAFAGRPAGPRPDEIAWLGPLKALQDGLSACPSNRAHHYPGHLQACPWCTIEARTGGRLFGQRLKPGADGPRIDIATLWAAVAAVPPPPPPPPQPELNALEIPPRSDQERGHLQARTLRRFMSLSLAAIFFAGCAWSGQAIAGFPIAGFLGLLLWPHAGKARRAAFAQAEKRAKTAFETAQRRWNDAAAGGAFATHMRQCSEAKQALETLSSERARRLAAVTSRAAQMERFLDRFQIGREKIPGIGPSRTAVLASFGIETAWDVTPAAVQAVPGFGPATAAKLIAWRQGKETQFQFNPNAPAPAADVQAVEADMKARAQQLAGVLRSGPALLRQASADAVRALAEAEPILKARWIDWRIAERRARDL